MERNFAIVTVFALLFAVTTARISLDPTPANIKSPPETAEGDSNLVLPSDTSKPGSDGTDRVQESDRDQRMFRVDVTPRSEFARFHAINRHFFDEPRIPLRSVQRRPYRHFLNPFVIPRSEISHGNEVILSAETGNGDAEYFHRQAPLKRLKFKHDYGHRHHRHQHHRFHHDNNVAKHKFDREKVKSLVQHQHTEKKREHEAGFMTSIRKFLKHTFD